MALLSLREAAKQVGVSRQTLYRLVKEGKVTATVGHDGQKVVDTAELLRVFGRLEPPSPATGETVSPATVTRQVETGVATAPQPAPRAAPGMTAMTAEERRREVEIADREALRAELAAAKDALRRTEEQLREAKEREAKLLDLAASATRLLEHRELPQAPPPRKGFWRRTFGG